MADNYEVTLRNKQTGEEIARNYDLDYVEKKNIILSSMYDALMEARKEKF